jgi:hypothetical protein
MMPAMFFGAVYIDAAHSADDVERDTFVTRCALRARGLVVWHDWNFPEVQEGVRRVYQGAVNISPAATLAWAIFP